MASVRHEDKPWLKGVARDLSLLSTAEMYRADAAAIAGGVPGTQLMAAAGAAVAEAILLRFAARPTLVLSGPGNNGGDGFIAARRLAEAGWPVTVALLGERAKLKGDAAWAAGTWPGPVAPVSPDRLDGAELVIDALFGAGLDRPMNGAARATIEALAARDIPVVAVDVPSGVSGNSGAAFGAVAPAKLTVTFFRKKPAHLLLPGRALCGETVVADIGIPGDVLDGIAPATAENGPALWRDEIRAAGPQDHKYTRGHVVVVAGEMPGAARLAALAAARIGAGMVTVLAAREALPLLVNLPAAVIVAALPKPSDLGEWLRARKAAAVLVGPGLGHGQQARALLNAVLASGLPAVLDADALAGLAEGARNVGRGRKAPLVLTPHQGEFDRLFGPGEGSRLDRARGAANGSGAVIVSKGFDSVIAAPDGRAAINANAPPWLATAGTGDVLAGLILGLIGQGTPPFAAASAAVWLHGRRAQERGGAMIADDLVNATFTV
jgi:NAD(P)H-hydrate epimerase